MNQLVKCPKCGNLRPADEMICGACGADLYPSDQSTSIGKAEFQTGRPPTLPSEAAGPSAVEKYGTVNVIKYIRRPMNSWLAIGTDYFNMYFLPGELVVAQVSSGRLGLIGALIGLPFYLIFFIITMQIGNMLDENRGKSQCDLMANRIDDIIARPAAYKLRTFKYRQRVTLEKNDTCNSGKMRHKVSIEGNEYYFDDFELDIAREKFHRYFDVIPSAA